MSIQTELKKYQARAKENKTVLGKLEAAAKEIADSQVQSDTAKDSLAQVESVIQELVDKKSELKERIGEAVILDTPELPQMREDFIGLNARVEELQGDAEKLKAVVAEHTPDPAAVASLRAELHSLKADDGSALLRAIENAVRADTEALRERVRAADKLLPSVDVVTRLDALLQVGGVDENYHRAAIESLEHNTALGHGESAVKQLEYQLEGMLTR